MRGLGACLSPQAAGGARPITCKPEAFGFCLAACLPSRLVLLQPGRGGALRRLGCKRRLLGLAQSFTQSCTTILDTILPGPGAPTGSWSARGSLAEMARPRMYHSVALLLPDCRVMVAGSDVTYDGTAEIFFPPYLSLGPRPAITAAPAAMRPGDVLRLGYTSTDPVDRVLLLRTGAFTHSMPFGEEGVGLGGFFPHSMPFGERAGGGRPGGGGRGVRHAAQGDDCSGADARSPGCPGTSCHHSAA